MRPYSSSRVKERAFNRKGELQMFLLISGDHIGAANQCTNQCVSVQSSTKVRETFWQITQKLWFHKHLRLGQIVYKLVFYNISSSWLVPLNGFQLNFLLHDSENDLYLSFAIFKRNCRIRSNFCYLPMRRQRFLSYSKMAFLLIHATTPLPYKHFDGRISNRTD